MTSSIDDAILSAARDHWTKVARVMAEVVDAAKRDLPPDDERLQVISRHIERLVRNGRLEAQGNIRNWRFSEVRRAGAHSKIHTEAPPKSG